MLLTCRKVSEALYIGQANSLTCFQRCQNIAVQLKFFILVFWRYDENLKLLAKTPKQEKVLKSIIPKDPTK